MPALPMTDHNLRIALFQPDIAANTGTILRMCACLGIRASIIEPAGFPVSDRHFRRAGMDYLDDVDLLRHVSWTAFESWRQNGAAAAGGTPLPARLVLMTTKAPLAYTRFSFRAGDILLAGRESAGVPATVHACVDASVCIPMRPQLRSLNVAVATAMIAGEAIRQIRETSAAHQMGQVTVGHPDGMTQK
jgi:tRNA (cytidine/uridine-2'-O-)-methyltransferase